MDVVDVDDESDDADVVDDDVVELDEVDVDDESDDDAVEEVPKRLARKSWGSSFAQCNK